MSSYLENNMDLVCGILEERFGKRHKLFNDPITTLQICQHILRVSINKSNYLHPEKKHAIKVGKAIFQALNLYSKGQDKEARNKVENVIASISKTGTAIKWPGQVKKSYMKFTNSFAKYFEDGNQVKALNTIDSFDTALEGDKDNSHVLVIKKILKDLRKAAKAWDPVKIEDNFYSLVEYYLFDPSEEESILVTT